MSEPNQVPELEGWVFIRDHPIAKEVERYELGRLRLARYVAKDGEFPDGQLAVMRLFLGDTGEDGPESNERWKAWVICVRCLDEDGEAMTREPNGYILTQLRAFDTWAAGRHPKHLQRYAAKIREEREKRKHEQFMEENEDRIGKIARGIRREMGLKSKVYVPNKSGLHVPN